MSRSGVEPHGGGKTVSTGFKFTAYDALEELARAMHVYSHSPSVYSAMIRWDKYNDRWVQQYRRRKHNVSFVGNVLAYDFDDGTLSMDEAAVLAEGFGFDTLLIRSRSDPKYDYDRFKMLVVTPFIYPAYSNDAVPDGYEAVLLDRYLDVYYGFAKKFGFFDNMDISTKDVSRLIARVVEKEGEVREYKIIKGAYIECQ